MRATLVLFLIGCAAGLSFAEDPPAADARLRAQIEGWLEDLRSDAYETRRLARDQLRTHGRRAPDLLEALADDTDAEVRRTVRELLGPGWKPKARPRGQAELSGLGQVEVRAGTTSLRAALDSIGPAQGARFELPKEHADAIQLDGDLRGPFFDILAKLRHQAGLAQPRPFDATGTAKWVAAAPGSVRAPQAAAGPLGVRVVEVSATRKLTSRAQPRYSLDLELRWAPSVQVTQLSAPRLVSAVDKSGCTFSGTAGRSTTTYGVGYTQTSRVVGLGIRPDDAACAEALAKLVFDVPGLRMRTGLRGVRFDGLDQLPQVRSGSGKRVAAGTPGSIELRAITKEGEGRRPQYVVELVGLFSSAIARGSAQVFVTWSSGREQRLHVMGGRSLSADGTLNLTVRAWPRGETTPQAIHVRWFEQEVEGVLQFTLRDVPLR